MTQRKTIMNKKKIPWLTEGEISFEKLDEGLYKVRTPFGFDDGDKFPIHLESFVSF